MSAVTCGAAENGNCGYVKERDTRIARLEGALRLCLKIVQATEEDGGYETEAGHIARAALAPAPQQPPSKPSRIPTVNASEAPNVRAARLDRDCSTCQHGHSEAFMGPCMPCLCKSMRVGGHPYTGWVPQQPEQE